MNYPAAIIGSVSLATVSACSAVPQLPTEQTLPIAAVVDQIQCELQAATAVYATKGGKLHDWGAAYKLSLAVQDQAGLAPTASVPFVVTNGTGTVGVGANVQRTATRTATLEFSLDLSALGKFKCPEPNPDTKEPFLTGELGLKEWVRRSVQAFDKDDVPQLPASIGHSVQFVIQANGNVQPSWVLAPMTIGFNLSAQEIGTNSLDVTLAPPDPDAKKPRKHAKSTAQINARSVLYGLQTERLINTFRLTAPLR